MPKTNDPQTKAGLLAETESAEMVTFVDLAVATLRHRRTVVTFTLVAVLASVVITLLLGRQWTATASFVPTGAHDVQMSRFSSLAGQLGVDIGAAAGAAESPEFYADLIQSRAILQVIASDSFEVVDTTGFNSDGSVRGILPDLIAISPDEPINKRIDKAVQWLREEAVTVSTNQETGIVGVAVTSRWPSLSGDIATRILEVVNEFNLDRRQSQAAQEKQFVEGRLATALQELRVAETEVKEFLQNNRLFDDSPELLFEHDRLQRRVAMRQQVYNSLLQSYEEARIAEVRNTPVITVVEVPQSPARPDSRGLLIKVIAGGLLGGLLGLGVAFARDYAERARHQQDGAVRELARLWRETKNDVGSLVRPFTRSL